MNGGLPRVLWTAWFFTIGPLVCPLAAAEPEFALKDGDTVAFLGDSITAARVYGKIIEDYTLLRYPDRKIRFVNAGRGGDTADGGWKRLKKDVLDRGATVLTVAYGVNDIGWGLKADEEHKQKYLQGIAGIVDDCLKANVRVYICSAAVTSQDPLVSESSYLQTMCDEGMNLSLEKGGGAIDVQRTMREIQKKIRSANQGQPDEKKHDSLHVADGVHLNDLGQVAMAYAILKGLGARPLVSAVEIDAQPIKVVKAENCSVTDLVQVGDKIEFTRLDQGLPFNHGLFFALHYRYVPLNEEMSQYLLTVKNLAKGKYEVTADGRRLGQFSDEQLERGINLGSATADPWEPGGPWNVQANVLQQLTDARHQLDLGGLLLNVYGGESPKLASSFEEGERVNSELEAMQRKVARPVPYRFVIQPAPANDPPKLK